jgi:hypothetical protein
MGSGAQTFNPRQQSSPWFRPNLSLLREHPEEYRIKLGSGPTPGSSRDQWTNNGCRNSTECSCCLYEVVVVLQDA